MNDINPRMVVSILLPILIGLAGWAWAISSRLAVLETNQRFLMEQRVEVQELTKLNYKMDKRLSILENYLMRRQYNKGDI